MKNILFSSAIRVGKQQKVGVYAFERLGIDPTVVSGPLITTLVDASGLFIYLTVAKLMISQLAGG